MFEGFYHGTGDGDPSLVLHKLWTLFVAFRDGGHGCCVPGMSAYLMFEDVGHNGVDVRRHLGATIFQ